jgi:uncharacterized protein DUF2589
MSRAVQELKQIPFGFLIGEPLKASIEAQALAARTTVEFIEKVGFVPPDPNQDPLFMDPAQDADTGKVRNVTFSYKKRDENGVEKDVSLTVPVLSIVPMPYLRIDEVTIDFTAKLNDTIEHISKTDFKVDASLSGAWKSWWSPLSLEFRTSISYEAARSSSARYTRDYTMQIHVRAVQDDIPAGLSRVLDILEQTIKEQPKPAGP